MYRRDFLKFGGVVSALAFFPVGQVSALAETALEAEGRGMVFRGTSTGEILVSDDQRSAWRVHTRLGPHYSIDQMFTGEDGQVYAKTSYQGYSFFLTLSENGRDWRTC